MIRFASLNDADSFVAWLASANAQAAVLIVAVLALRVALGPRLTPGWRGALWLFVALRLLLPVAIESRYSLASLARRFAATPDAVAAKPAAPVERRVSVRYGPPPAEAVDEAPTLVVGSPGVSPAAYAIGVWLAGVAIVAGRNLFAAAALRRAVRRMRPIDDAASLALLARCAEEIGVRRRVRLVETDRLRAPAVCGLFRPTIVLPAGRAFAVGELRLMLLHELAHVRRNDPLAAAVARLVVAIHWFNPFVWLASAAFRADRELACDAAVLARLDDSSRRAYGECVIRVVAEISGRPTRVAGLGLFGPAGSLRRRIEMIADRSDRASRFQHGVRAIIGASAFAVIGCGAVAGEPSATRAPSTMKADAGAATARLTEALNAPIGERFEVDGLTLEDAIKHFGRVAAIQTYVNWPALEAAGVSRAKRVTLVLREDVPKRKVLQILLDSAGGGVARLESVVDNGVVTISTRDDLTPVETRTYDIHDLLVQIPDFNADSATTQPTVDAAERAERIKLITDLIVDTIYTESWRSKGGKLGTIRELDGQLIITQTAESLDDIARLLGQLRETRGIQITVEARFIEADPSIVPTDLGRDSRPGEPPAVMLNDARAVEILRQIDVGAGAMLTAPQIMLFNGQSGSIQVAESTPYRSDYAITRSASGEQRFEPTTATAPSGVSLDVQATVSADRKFVTITLGPKVTRLVRFEEVPYAGDPNGGLTVQKPIVETESVRTTVSIPVGGTLLLSAGKITATAGKLFEPVKPGDATKPAGEARPPRQLLLLVKPRVIDLSRK